MFPIPAQTFFDLGRIVLNPSVNRCVINLNTAYTEQFLQIAVADSVFAAPTHGSENNLTAELTPLKI